MKDLSLHLFSQPFISIIMNSGMFILQVKNTTLLLFIFMVKFFQWKIFQVGLSVNSDVPFFVVVKLPHILELLQDALVLFVISLAPALKSTISSRRSSSYNR